METRSRIDFSFFPSVTICLRHSPHPRTYATRARTMMTGRLDIDWLLTAHPYGDYGRREWMLIWT